MSERDGGKCECRRPGVRENVGRGAEGGMLRENVELRKLVMILVLYSAGAEVNVETGLVLKTIYPVSKLTFKSV